MSIVKRTNNFRPSANFFDDFVSRDLFNWPDWSGEGESLPKVNIIEDNDEFRVEMAAPGMKKEDFQVELDNDMLTISSEWSDKRESQDGESKYTRKEFSFKSFKRSFYLPNTVETEKIHARYENGILRLSIPKKEEAKKKPVKTISIS